MQHSYRPVFATIGAALVFGLGLSAPTTAQERHDHGAPLHGGKVAMTKEYHFEAVFAKDGLKLYPRTHEDRPVDASRLTGTATFYHPNSPKPWFERKLAATPASPGQKTMSLDATIDLSKVPATGAKVSFKVSGLPEAAEPTATFTIPFALAASNEVVVAKATKADDKAVAAQKTCPISKEELDSMGGPWKVSRGGKSTFICCKSCLKQVQADPDKYLGVPASAATKGGNYQ
jgi:YHS domain-containing protein